MTQFRDTFTRLIMISALMSASTLASHAQDLGTLNPKPLPPLANPSDPKNSAKAAFGRKTTPTTGPTDSIGFYSKGCLAGAAALPITGPTWQVMRLSRNRNWARPEMVELLERLSAKAPKVAGWPGILVGDMSQPRGGPMITGHASHQIGLDADVWLTPMPNHVLSPAEREEMSAIMMVRPDRLDIDPKVWTPGQMAIIHAAADEPQVERIFVNPAIKKAMCRDAGADRAWLSKIRPYWGHDYHFHIRIKCPVGATDCKPQDPPPAGDGCDSKDFSYWFSDAVLHPKPPKVPPKPTPPMTVAELPTACQQVLLAP